MMLELVLLKIYKLNKFTGPIPQISFSADSHVLTDGNTLYHLTKYCLQILVSVPYFLLIKLQKSDSRLLSAALTFCFMCICISCKGASLRVTQALIYSRFQSMGQVRLWPVLSPLCVVPVWDFLQSIQFRYRYKN